MSSQGKGEVVDSVEVGDYTVSVRFVDWDRPDHRDTQGHAVPRYSLGVLPSYGETLTDHGVTFDYWGSIRQAQEGDYADVDASTVLRHVVEEALAWYDSGGGSPDEVQLTASALQDEIAPIVDELAQRWMIEQPSEAVRVVGSILDHVRKFDQVGLDEDAIYDFYEEIRVE